MDIYDAILPVYILSKILGLAPFRLVITNNKKSFQSSVGLIIILRFIGVMGSMIYVAYLLDTLHLQYDLRGVALRCELCTGFILTSTMLISAVINRKLLISIVEDIIRIDKKMEKAGILISFVNAKRFSIFQIIAITCMFLTKAIIQPFTAEHAFVSIYNIFNIVDYINTITLFQYVDLLLLLRQRYIWLNRELKKQIHTLSFKSKTINKNEQQFIKVKPFHKNNDTENNLQKISVIHDDLFQISRKINEAYSFRLLVTIGMRFIMITTQILTLYKMIFGKQKNHNETTTFFLIGIYLLLHTTKVFMVASLSSNTAEKAKQSGKIIHNIWKSSAYTKHWINCFSLQVLQQEISFDARGFFILDYALIYNMTAALTVYLIILIQFDSSISLNSLVNCNSTQ